MTPSGIEPETFRYCSVVPRTIAPPREPHHIYIRNIYIYIYIYIYTYIYTYIYIYKYIYLHLGRANPQRMHLKTVITNCRKLAVYSLIQSIEQPHSCKCRLKGESSLRFRSCVGGGGGGACYDRFNKLNDCSV